MKDKSYMCEKCKTCNNSCSGIGKNLLTIEELDPIPARCFVDEIDLNEGDRKIISNPKRDGAIVSLIDSLLYEEQVTLQTAIGSKDLPHYVYNETVWVKTAMYFFGEKNHREPTAEEFLDLNKTNDPKYRLEYMLLFPHFIKINERARPEQIDKLKIFLKKADEVAAENIYRHGFNGACGLFTFLMMDAQNKGKTYTPSYTKAIFQPQNLISI